MTTIQAGTSPPDVINDMGARLRRNGIDPDDVHRVDLLPLRFARIHELARNERGKHYVVNDGHGTTFARKRPYLRWLRRR